MSERPYADDLNYWKTSRKSADTWLEDTVDLIEKMGGRVVSRAFGQDGCGAAFLLAFEAPDGERFKLVWPVLETKHVGDEKSARVQAATMIYHHVKSLCLAAKVFGIRTAFFSHYLLPDGQTVTELTDDEVQKHIPALIAEHKPRPAGFIE